MGIRVSPFSLLEISELERTKYLDEIIGDAPPLLVASVLETLEELREAFDELKRISD